MKMITSFLLISLIIASKSQLEDFGDQKTCSEYESGTAFSLDFCRSLSYDGSKYRCCYFQYENSAGNTEYHCKQLTLAQFADIDDTIDKLTNSTIKEIEKLDCHSSYLYASLLLIFALLL